MVCSEIISKLETIAPLELQDDWDNSGLLAGDFEAKVNKVYISLDASSKNIQKAIECNADLLITHHPLIFKPLYKINDQNFISRRILTLIKNNVNYYSMHTNFDKTVMSFIAAKRLNLLDAKVLELTNGEYGYGQIGNLPDKTSVRVLCDIIKDKFSLDKVKLFGNQEDVVTKIAIIPGSGKSFIKEAILKGAQVLITGDIDHHDGIDAVENGLIVIDAGHYGIEHIFVDYISEFIKNEFKNIEIYAEDIESPFMYL